MTADCCRVQVLQVLQAARCQPFGAKLNHNLNNLCRCQPSRYYLEIINWKDQQAEILLLFVFYEIWKLLTRSPGITEEIWDVRIWYETSHVDVRCDLWDIVVLWDIRCHMRETIRPKEWVVWEEWDMRCYWLVWPGCDWWRYNNTNTQLSPQSSPGRHTAHSSHPHDGRARR